MYIVYHKDVGDDPMITGTIDQILEPATGHVAFVQSLKDACTWMTAEGRDPHDYEICDCNYVPFTVERIYDVKFDQSHDLPRGDPRDPPPRPDPSTPFKKG